jgi:hypothetical protein
VSNHALMKVDVGQNASRGNLVKRMFQLLMPILVAVGIGPMIAGLLVCSVALFTTIFDWTGALHVTDLPGAYIIFSYILASQSPLWRASWCPFG